MTRCTASNWRTTLWFCCHFFHCTQNWTALNFAVNFRVLIQPYSSWLLNRFCGGWWACPSVSESERQRTSGPQKRMKSDFIYCAQCYRPRSHKLDLPLSEGYVKWGGGHWGLCYGVPKLGILGWEILRWGWCYEFRGRISVGHRRRPGRAQGRAFPVDHEKECSKVGNWDRSGTEKDGLRGKLLRIQMC